MAYTCLWQPLLLLLLPPIAFDSRESTYLLDARDVWFHSKGLTRLDKKMARENGNFHSSQLTDVDRPQSFGNVPPSDARVLKGL